MNHNDKPDRAKDAERMKSLRFISLENRVHDALGHLVARCKSANFAKRIARALNTVEPDERGQ